MEVTVYFIDVYPACDCHKNEWRELYGSFHTKEEAENAASSIYPHQNVTRIIESLPLDEFQREYGCPDYDKCKIVWSAEW